MPRVSGHNLGVTGTEVSVSFKPSPSKCQWTNELLENLIDLLPNPEPKCCSSF